MHFFAGTIFLVSIVCFFVLSFAATVFWTRRRKR
jgi:hypothetical protein